MICPNCGAKNIEGSSICVKCGVDLKNNQQFNNNIERNKKNSKIPLVIVCIIILGLIVGLGYVGINYFNKEIDNKENNDNNKDNVVKEKYNSIEKLKSDYESGKLSVNDYFTQLVYLEYDSLNMDSKYKSDYEYYNTVSELDTYEILEKYYDQLDKDIVKFYLTNKSLANVVLGDEKNDVVKQSGNANNDYEVKQLDSEEDKKNAANHRLDKVYLSENENFLIWYTNSGDDSINDEQLKSIANGLESSIKKYKQYFGIDYSYSPYIDNKIFNDDWKNAKEVLTKNNMPASILKKAMSVYVYDTGSESVLAFYADQEDGAKIINRSLYLDVLDNDGIMNYPYIVINRKGLLNSNDSLIQLYNHELFHHMQYLFCKSTSGERCIDNLKVTESMANFASSIVSDVNTTNNFLNGWAGTYTQNTSTKLPDIVDGGGKEGYGIFPYFYSYSIKSNNWANVLMNTHIKSNPFRYIQNNTSKEDLIETINHLAYYTLSQSYDNKSLISNTGIKYKLELKDKKLYNLNINNGSIDYFELNFNTKLNASTNNNDYITLIVYGYKDGVYKELKSSNDKIDVDTSFYQNYDKLYLVVTNGNLVNSYNYTINLDESKYLENNEYKTTFNNYNIEITMNTDINGIKVKQHSKGTVDELHQKEYLSFDTTTMGITVSNKIYYDFNTGYTYMTQPFGGDVWWKEKGTSQMIDLGNILDKLISMKNVTKVSDNHFKVKMTKDEIKGLMSSPNTNSSLINGDVSIDVYTENGYIIKLEYDFSKMVSGIDLFKTTIKFSNYDSAGDVNIPKSIIDNAISQ